MGNAFFQESDTTVHTPKDKLAPTSGLAHNTPPLSLLLAIQSADTKHKTLFSTDSRTVTESRKTVTCKH